MKTQTDICFDCRKPFPAKSPEVNGVAFYVTVRTNGSRVCYDCADKRQVESLRDRSQAVIGYVSASKTITTFTGGKLMTILSSRPCKLVRRSWTHDRNSYKSIRAVDVHGGHWAGRGSEGIAIKLRPVKS